MMKTLAIIGTAGRREDASKLTVKHWNAMCRAAIGIVESDTAITDMVSGGAAWADHVAVRLHSHFGVLIRTTIWLPGVPGDIGTAKYYHGKFSHVLGRDTWAEVLAMDEFPTAILTSFGGFKDRNTKVADAADVFLACTFGDGPKVKDGGTLDTVNKMLARGIPGYHFDLNALQLQSIPNQATP